LFRMLIMQSSMTIDTMRIKQRIKRSITMDLCYLFGDSLQRKEEERMLPLFAGTLSTRIYLPLDMGLTSFRRRQLVLFAVIRSRILHGLNTSPLRAESCVLISIRNIKLFWQLDFMMELSWSLISDLRATNQSTNQT